MSFNNIINPNNGEKVSIFSNAGKNLLKQYISMIGGGKCPKKYDDKEFLKKCRKCNNKSLISYFVHHEKEDKIGDWMCSKCEDEQGGTWYKECKKCGFKDKHKW